MHWIQDLFSFTPRPIHLDYASTTPVRKDVLEAMLPYFTEEWANPSAIYASALRAREAIDDARTRVAQMLRVRPHGIIFTSGGTESNNHALIGVVEALHRRGRAYEDMEILTTEIEHASILSVCDLLRDRGVVVQYIPLQSDGCIDIARALHMLSTRTVLVTVAYVNSEIGVIQDIKRLTRGVRAFNAANGTATRVHLDAAQAPLWLPCEMDMLGVDLMSLDSGKCYGPKGAGVLACRHGVDISPFMYGGGQEGGLRSGTENTPLIVGLSHALVVASRFMKERSERVARLRDYFFSLLTDEIEGVLINGSRDARIANNVHISIPGIESEFAVITLDHHGIAASTKSACGAEKGGGSGVIRTLTGDEARATSTLRFTLGEETTRAHIRRAVSVLRAHVEATRKSNEALGL